MRVNQLLKHVHTTSVFKIVAPQDGGWSLSRMEQLLRGLRNHDDTVSLEIFGNNGVISYGVRSSNGDTVAGMFHSYFPQARVSRHIQGEVEEVDRSDWLHIGKGELAMVQSLSLAKESYLPLKIFDDRSIEQSQTDPLAGIIGCLASCTQGGAERSGDRLGIRLVIRPAAENWNAPWQSKMQQRRDGEDRTPKAGSGPKADTGPSMGMLMGLGGLAGFVGGNYLLWEAGNIPGLALFNVGSLAAIAGGVGLMKKFSGNSKRTYMDEELVEAKLKSLAFWSELQVIRIYSQQVNVGQAHTNLDQVLDCLRGFDDPAGNSWAEGKVREFSGDDVVSNTSKRHPFVSWGQISEETDKVTKEKDLVIGNEVLSWIDPKRARRTALSAREVASLWHLPLGTEEMASMERTASGIRIPYLADLGLDGEDAGPLVGMAGDLTQKIRLPESSIEKHAIILGRSGVGKSTMIKHVLAHKFERKAAGKDSGAIVVIDPHADLVRDALKMVPVSIAHKVRLLDFGRMDRVPGINLVDPLLFPDRDRCVDTIIETVKHLWEHWGGRLEDLLKRSLLIVYEFNSHPETKRSEMLTMLDILTLLDDGETVGRGRDARTEMSGFQSHVLSRVKDVSLKQWFNAYLGWDRALRSEATGPVHSRIGAYASDQRAKVIMGQRESTIMLSDVLSEGLILLISTAKGSIGEGPAALMGGTMVSLVESALRQQEHLAFSERSKCLLICDEFQTVTGANWEGLLAEIRKYGCSLMLATQSLARLDTPERKLKAGILGNVGCIIGYQMAAEDAHIISPEMDSERVPEGFLVNLHPHHCYVRINSATKCYPSFSMITNAPPDETKGSEESVQAVIEASKAYTVDAEEVRNRINAEGQARMDKMKVGAEPGEVSSVESAARRLNITPIEATLGKVGSPEASPSDKSEEAPKPDQPGSSPGSTESRPAAPASSGLNESKPAVPDSEKPGSPDFNGGPGVDSDISPESGDSPSAPSFSSVPTHEPDFNLPAVQGEVQKAAGDNDVKVNGNGNSTGTGVAVGEVSEKTGAPRVLGNPAGSEDSGDSGKPLSVQPVAPNYGRGDSEAAGSLREGGGVEIIKSGNPSPSPEMNGKTVLKEGSVLGDVQASNGSAESGLDPSLAVDPSLTADSSLTVDPSLMVDSDGKVMLQGARGDSITLQESTVDSGADPLNELDATDVANSDFAPEVLRAIMFSTNTDKGLRTALDKRLGNHISRERRKVWRDESIKVRAEAQAEIQVEFEKVEEERLQVEEERSQIEASIVAAAEKVREEEKVKARADLGAKMSEGRGDRSMDRLKSVN